MGNYKVTAVILVLSILVSGAWAQEREEAQQETRSFGGAYSSLTPEQTRLVDDWVRAFNDLTGRGIEPEVFYDDFVRLSTKVTFDAVTHALMRTTLTDASGNTLGTALDLVAQLETVRGKVKGQRGDRQFRMYVKLKPDAVDILNKSQEFHREADNTIYHKGYPLNYRQSGSVPSIQISIASSKERADIDVDYRSSKFPVALFNGHLSSSNSDVRAGNNYERHNSRWQGFANWWRSLFGVQLRDSDYVDELRDASFTIPEFPRAGKDNLADAVHDFLSVWLIEQKANLAAAYFSERSFSCIQAEIDNPGMIPIVLMNGLEEIEHAVGKPEKLEDVVVGVRLAEPALKLVRQPYHALFVLYGVPDDVALTFECANRTAVADATSIRASSDYGNYYGSVFYIQGPLGRGATLALLWAKESGYWKIISYELEPYAEEEVDTGYEPPEVAELERVDGDPTMVEAARDFLKSWFIDEDYEKAFNYLSPLCYPCYNLFRAEGRPEAQTAEEAGRYLREGLEMTGDLVGRHSRLDEFMKKVDPSHPMVRLVTHSDEETFTLLSVPNATWEWFDCASRLRGQPMPSDLPLEYGDYYGLVFEVRMKSGEPPVMRTLWTKQDGRWKIVAYDIVTP